MAQQIIKRKKRNTLSDTLGAIGQGISGYAGGYMGRQQMDMAQKNQAMTQELMKRAFGSPSDITPPMPETQPPLQITPDPSLASMAAPSSASPMSMGMGLTSGDLLSLLLSQGALQRPLG